MLTWANLALVLLQVVNKILGMLQQDKLIDAGYEKAIAEQAALILKNNQYAKQVMASVIAMSSDDTDKLLHSLEPKPTTNGF